MNITSKIKNLALEIGFDACGIAKAEKLSAEEPRLKKWLSEKLHGDMAWMENHFEKRLDPSKLVEGAKSAVVVLLNYFPEKTQYHLEAPQISKYAYGKDYHDLIKNMLKQLLNKIKTIEPTVEGRAFVDSAPLLERALAVKAGLGWIGKNSLLLNKKMGSFFFIGELILNLDLEPDQPIKDFCGDCTRCIEACPTHAIVEPRLVNGSKCISYFTIEYKEEKLPEEYKGKFNNYIFGCDICQDVCPWNKKVKAHSNEELKPKEELLSMTKEDFDNLTEEKFRKLFKDSPVKRAKFSGLMRNKNNLK